MTERNIRNKRRAKEFDIQPANFDTSKSGRPVRKILAGARVRSGIKATELARKLGISPSGLSMIENGERPLKLDLFLKIKEIVPLLEEEETELGKKVQTGADFLKRLAQQVFTDEIVQSPKKTEALVSFARMLSEDHTIDEFIAGMTDKVHFESNFASSKLECDLKRT